MIGPSTTLDVDMVDEDEWGNIYSSGFQSSVFVGDFTNSVLAMLREYDPVTDSLSDIIPFSEGFPTALPSASELLSSFVLGFCRGWSSPFLQCSRRAGTSSQGTSRQESWCKEDHYSGPGRASGFFVGSGRPSDRKQACGSSPWCCRDGTKVASPQLCRSCARATRFCRRSYTQDASRINGIGYAGTDISGQGPAAFGPASPTRMSPTQGMTPAPPPDEPLDPLKAPPEPVEAALSQQSVDRPGLSSHSRRGEFWSGCSRINWGCIKFHQRHREARSDAAFTSNRPVRLLPHAATADLQAPSAISSSAQNRGRVDGKISVVGDLFRRGMGASRDRGRLAL